MEQGEYDSHGRVRYPLAEIQHDSRFLDAHWLLGNWSAGFDGLKRLLDLVACIPLLVIGLLTFPFVALAIKLDSRGPVFYVQQRTGKDGATFPLYKYRSMVVDAEVHGARFASKNDARVTRIGTMLRTTRLDEVPQVINVLRGHMSVVGPRPERPHVIAELVEKIPQFAMRTVVRPGLTGWAQVRGSYAATEIELAEKLEYDLFYIHHASLRLDLRILIETIAVVFRRRGL